MTAVHEHGTWKFGWRCPPSNKLHVQLSGKEPDCTILPIAGLEWGAHGDSTDTLHVSGSFCLCRLCSHLKGTVRVFRNVMNMHLNGFDPCKITQMLIWNHIWSINMPNYLKEQFFPESNTPQNKPSEVNKKCCHLWRACFIYWHNFDYTRLSHPK